MLPGFDRALPSSPYWLAKFTLNDFAVGPLVLDFTNSAFDWNPDGRSAPKRLVASMAVFPSRPCTLSSAASIAPPGTATSTASASETSPPSLPIRVTSWPAFSQRSASPPPTFPLPITAIFISPLPSSLPRPTGWVRGYSRPQLLEVRFPPMARDYPTVLELVGNTPIVRLDSVGRDVEPLLLAKLEYLNPGGSVKDRIGLAMIEKAEAEGKLRPGGTIVEPTSGNTGVGLAIAAAKKGYRCIFVMPDKMSQEKISMLRAYGAEVVICPTAVEPDSPESYYSVSDRLAEEIPGGFKPDQYSNMSNPEAHYLTTGPEIWEQTVGEVDAIVISVGTGGTISGVGRYFKERAPQVQIVGVDPEGSIYTAETESQLHPYLVEGIGKDTWPDTIDL